MNYNFNKKLIEQVKAGTHCIEFNPEKDSLEMLQALLRYTFPYAIGTIQGTRNYYEKSKLRDTWFGVDLTDKAPIPLSNFVQPEQSERDVMAELDERLKRLEDILLKDTEISKAEPEIVNPVRWRAEKGEEYYAVDAAACEVYRFLENNDKDDDILYNCGNYFQTKEQAEEMAVLMQFTLNNPELVKQLMDKKE